MEVSARHSATLPGRPLCADGVYGRSSPVSLCSLQGSPGALNSDVHWPAQPQDCLQPMDLEPTTNGPRITRTVALLLQAPAQDSFVCSSTRQCWLQLWVSCTIVQRCCDCTASSASTTNVQTRLNWVTHNQDLLTRVWSQLKAVEHCLPRWHLTSHQCCLLVWITRVQPVVPHRLVGCKTS